MSAIVAGRCISRLFIHCLLRGALKMKTIEPVRDNDVSIQLTIMQGQLDTILSELQALRLERLPASPELIESLLASLYKIYPDVEFTAVWILETCVEGDMDANILLQSIKGVMTGAVPGSKNLSRFLGKVTGIFGGYRLDISNPHTRDGATFRVSVTM